jgi:quercetin dioxygenase-like cupin family protein
VTGKDTAGRYCLIDMHVPPGGGPPPHRHDFEEMFTVLEGEIDVTFRGETSVALVGESVNVPANAPHAFHNSTSAGAAPVHVLAAWARRVFHGRRRPRRDPPGGLGVLVPQTMRWAYLRFSMQPRQSKPRRSPRSIQLGGTDGARVTRGDAVLPSGPRACRRHDWRSRCGSTSGAVSRRGRNEI